MATLLSVNVGLPRIIEWDGRRLLSAIWKSPQSGPVQAGCLGLDGDAVADVIGHGGEVRAVLVYQISSYHYWNKVLDREGFEYGQFGENFTVDGLADDEVCIGDQYRIGTAVFEVSQPRVPCFKVGLRMGSPELPGLLVAHGRPGFYMRVIQEGQIQAGDEIIKIEAGNEQMTVTDIDALLYKSAHPVDLLEKALRIHALSPGWKGAFEQLLKFDGPGSPSGNPGLTSGDEFVKSWSGFRPLRITAIHQESVDVKSFELEDPSGAPLPCAIAGQHIAVKLAVRGKGAAVTRFYSLSGPPKAGRYRISVKRVAGGSASSCLHDSAGVGTLLEATAPQGAFKLEPGNNPVVIISAGIGATPMVAMLHALVDENAKGSRREVWWLHGAQNEEHHPFRAEVDDLLNVLENVRRHVFYSRPYGPVRAANGSVSFGRLDFELLKSLAIPSHADFYLCGPAGFLFDVHHALLMVGVPPTQIQLESFGAASVQEGGLGLGVRRPHQPDGRKGTGPKVNFVRSGIVVPWSDQFSSLLALAEACDVPVRWSCRSGVCHSCQSNVLHGEFTNDSEPLSPPAFGTVLICCAKPHGDVDLDL